MISCFRHDEPASNAELIIKTVAKSIDASSQAMLLSGKVVDEVPTTSLIDQETKQQLEMEAIERAKELLKDVPSSLLLVVPVTILISELNSRIHSTYKIPFVCYYLFCGRYLEPTESLPLECLEKNQILDEDQLLFRARLIMFIDIGVMDPRYADDKDDSLTTNDGPISQHINKQETKLSEEAMYSKQHNNQISFEQPSFDLKSELNQIDCGLYFQQLEKAGYWQEGAFASLREHDLKSLGILIPPRACRRILALAEVIQRNRQHAAAQQSARHPHPHNEEETKGKELWNKAKHHVVTDGMDGRHKPLSTKLILKIGEIKARIARDGSTASPVQNDLLVCCDNHAHKVDVKRQQITDVSQLRFYTEIMAPLHWMSSCGIELAPLESMMVVARKLLNRWPHRPIDTEQFEEFMRRKAFLTVPELQSIELSNAYNKHGGFENRYSLVAVNLYSKDKFARTLIGFIAQHDPHFFIAADG